MANTVVRRTARSRDATGSARARKASAIAGLRPLVHLFNRPAVAIAGTRLLPFWSLVRHQGRRSGRRFATPVAARRTSDGFAIPLAFGENADWCRNVMAAGGCVVRWSGRDHLVVDPVIVDAESAIAAFSPFERRVLRAAHLQRVLLVRDAKP